MKKIIRWLKHLINLIVRLIKKPKTWLFHDLGLTFQKPPSRPQDKSSLEIEELEEPKPIRTRERVNCYRDYSKLLVDLLSGCSNGEISVGSTIYIQQGGYIEHHLERKPGANPRSFYNGPLPRELRNNKHQYFEKRGIKFEQCRVKITNNEHGFKAGEVFFELKRIK